MARPPSTQPTDGELGILKILWRVGPAELGTIRAALQESRPVASTTVATMLKLMREKGLVQRGDGPRGYLWSASVSQEATRSGLLGKLLNIAFDGSAHRLVAHLFEEGKLSDQDRDAIRRMLDSQQPKRSSKRGARS
jgi:BlaI family penicillinase repressor